MSAPSLADPAAQDRAELLHRVVLLSFAGVLGQVVVVSVVPTMSGSVAVMLPVAALLIGILRLLHLGWVRLAASLMVYGFGAIISLFLFFGGGIEAGYPILMALVAVEAGLMIGYRAGLAVTAWTLVACVLVYAFGASDRLLVPGQDLRAVLLSTQLMGVGLLGALVAWATFRLHASLADARASADALRGALTALSDARSTSERLVRSMAEPVWVTTPGMVVLDANDAARHWLDVDPIGERLDRWLVMPPLDDRRVRGPGVLTTHRGDVPVQVSRSVVGTGDDAQWIFVTTDLSRRVEAEAKIREAAAAAEDANRAKSQFLASISHELRTPLNAILGYTELLIEGAADDDDTREDLDRVRRSGVHLLGLINDLLDMSKIEAGKMEVATHSVDLVAVVQEVVDRLRPLAAAQLNTLLLDLPPSLVAITDGRKVEQILTNLVSNAVKYTDGGTVRVVAVGAATRITIAVADTGRGIRDEDMARLFQPFRQLGPDVAVQPGTGLGLVLSQRLAGLVGGRIDARSAWGVGSTFTLELPRDASQP